MQLDEIDIKILKENYDDYIIQQINLDNVNKIFNYLIENGIFYAKDLFISNLPVFLIEYNDFKKKFDVFKEKIGENYINALAEDNSLIEYMYQ